MILFWQRPVGCSSDPWAAFVGFCVGAATGGLLIISAATGGLRKICTDFCLGAPFPQDGCVLCFVLHFGCMGCVTVVMCACGWPLPVRELRELWELCLAVTPPQWTWSTLWGASAIHCN